MNISSLVASTCIRLTISPSVRCCRAEAESRSDLPKTPVVMAVRICQPDRIVRKKYAFSATDLIACMTPSAAARPKPTSRVRGRNPKGSLPSMKAMTPKRSTGKANWIVELRSLTRGAATQKVGPRKAEQAEVKTASRSAFSRGVLGGSCLRSRSLAAAVDQAAEKRSVTASAWSPGGSVHRSSV